MTSGGITPGSTNSWPHPEPAEAAAGANRILIGFGSFLNVEPMRDPVPEIIRSFREAEISESEKNSLLSLVCEEDEADFCDEEVCITDPYADELATAGDDDEIG